MCIRDSSTTGRAAPHDPAGSVATPASTPRFALRREALRIEARGDLDGVVRSTQRARDGIRAVVEVDGIGSLPAVADLRTACVPGQRVSLRLDGDHVVPVGRAAVSYTPLDVYKRQVHGYQSLGWYDGGAIAPGLLADFITVDLESTRTAGSKAAEILYTASACDVLTVVVGGRTIVEDGQHAFGPVAPLMREALSLIRDQG